MNDRAGHEIGAVGELIAGTNVSGSKNSPVGGPQHVVDQHSRAVITHPRRLQIQPLKIRRAPSGEQEVVDGQIVLHAHGIERHQNRAVGAWGQLQILGRRQQVDAVLLQSCLHDGCGLWVFSW